MTSKYAIAHCRILPGGALEVLKKLLMRYTLDNNVVIYTLFSDRRYLEYGEQKIKIITALPFFLQKIFLQKKQQSTISMILSKIFDYRKLIALYPFFVWILSKKIQQKKYTHIIISSFAVAKNITHTIQHTTLYLHSPLQYIHTHFASYKKHLGIIQGTLLASIKPFLYTRDTKKRNFSTVYVNSIYTGVCAKNIYNINSPSVLYPPVDTMYKNTPLQYKRSDYFISYGRISTLIKHIDIVITACNIGKISLIVIGDGPDLLYCKSIAGPTIQFIERLDHNKIAQLLASSQGSINIGHESAGMTTIESLSAGVPVIGRNIGATPEFIDEENGILIDTLSVEELLIALKKCIDTKWDYSIIRSKVEKFLANRGL